MKSEWHTPRVERWFLHEGPSSLWQPPPSKEEIQRWRRIIRYPGGYAYKAFHEVWHSLSRIDPEAAADVCDHMAAIFRTQIHKQRRGQRNPEDDTFLLNLYGAWVPGELPNTPDSEKRTLETFAHWLAKFEERWGREEQIFERVRKLVVKCNKERKASQPSPD